LVSQALISQHFAQFASGGYAGVPILTCDVVLLPLTH
jgi:hypothetical protein